MPSRTETLPQTGATVIMHTCETCGKAACFGVGVSIRKALNALDKGLVDLARDYMGKWYCQICLRLIT